MIKLQADKMTKAIERSKAQHPRVRVVSASERTYSVTGSQGNAYTVKFVVVNGLRLGECDCPAGRREQVCYHLASAAQVNVMTQSMRQGASVPAVSYADERAGLISSIKSTWSARFPNESLADELMARFRVNYLEALSVDFLRRVLTAITL